VVADSFRLRNRQLLVAAKRYAAAKKDDTKTMTINKKDKKYEISSTREN
jgi:hypothetical protein